MLKSSHRDQYLNLSHMESIYSLVNLGSALFKGSSHSWASSLLTPVMGGREKGSLSHSAWDLL